MPLPAKRPAFLNWLGLMLLAVALAGCGRDNVKVYRLSNDDSSSAAPPPDTTATAAPTSDQNENNAAQPQLQWTLPAGWTEVAPGEMSIASFKVSGPNGAEADVTVVPLPGMAGGDTANVNRWRGQVGLPAATADELQKMGEDGPGRRPVRRRFMTLPANRQRQTHPGRDSTSQRHDLVF